MAKQRLDKDLSRTEVCGLALLLICAALALSACEDEPPSIPRGGEPPSEEAAPAPAATAGNAAANSAAAGTETNKDGAAAPKKKASRVPTASELMGYGKAEQAGQSGTVPAYLGGGSDKSGPSPLFVGKSKKPGAAYRNMRTRNVPVSPLERNWRGASAGKNEESKNKKAVNVLAMLETDEGSLFEKQESQQDESPDSAESKKEQSEDKKFKLLLYKLNAQTGDVDVFQRSFKTQEAHDAAERFAIQQGYQHKKPVVSRKAKTAKSDADPKAKDAKNKDEKVAEKCPFKATFTEMQGGNSVSQTRCFSSQKALDQFMAQRSRAKAAAAKKATQTAPKPAANTPANKSGADDSLAPAKLD